MPQKSRLRGSRPTYRRQEFRPRGRAGDVGVDPLTIFIRRLRRFWMTPCLRFHSGCRTPQNCSEETVRTSKTYTYVCFQSYIPSVKSQTFVIDISILVPSRWVAIHWNPFELLKLKLFVTIPTGDLERRCYLYNT